MFILRFTKSWHFKKVGKNQNTKWFNSKKNWTVNILCLVANCNFFFRLQWFFCRSRKQLFIVVHEVASVFSYIINLLMCRFSWSPRGSRCKLRVGKIFGLDTWIRRSFGRTPYHWNTSAETSLSKHMILSIYHT